MKTLTKTILMKTNLVKSLMASLFFACSSAALIAATVPSAEAARPEPASGEFFPCFNYAGPPRQVGENVIITFNISGTSTGSVAGSVVGTELDVVHRDGSITLHGSFLFTGSVNGRSGPMVFSYEGIGNAVTGHETVHFVGRQGAGDLAGTYVNVTAEGDVGAPSPGCDVSGAGTYTGTVIFAPLSRTEKTRSSQ